MKILLIYPNIVESPKDISLGLGTISALLKKNNHQVELLDSTFGLSDDAVVSKIRTFKPELVGITAATNDLNYAIHICNLIKKSDKTIPIICGGYHATIAPEDIIAQDCFDMACIGEGEYAFLELAASLEKGKINSRIKNIWFKLKAETGAATIIKNSLRPLNNDLDSLPFADRELFSYDKYLDYNKGIATFIASKGCPFACAHCINNYLIKKYKGLGAYVRFRSAGSIIAEIKSVLSSFGDKVREIEFYDDTFTLNKRLVRKFSESYPQEICLPFNINIRAGSVTKDDLVLLKKAGCVRVSIGIESGDEFIRNKILKRNQTEQIIIDTFSWAKEAGLQTYAFNMVGIPHETRKTIKKTIELNKKCRPDFVGVSIFNAYKGTELFDLCEQNNLLVKDIAAKSYFQSTNVKQPNLSITELKKIRDRFGFDVYKDSRPLRAYLDLFDKTFIRVPFYLRIRSLITKLGMKKLLKQV